ncbi:MAG: heavy metal translocating P-type ATPase [Acidimicrobiia bacterium]|nr:heavy metal translocating P-type ATPase [Acidimicrobiia bacterium]
MTDQAGHQAMHDHGAHAHPPTDHASPAPPPAHDKHAGHSPGMFRDRLVVSLLLTVPILYLSDHIQSWFGFRPVEFTGDGAVTPLAATVLFFYAGSVFIRGSVSELRHRVPGMMTLITLAIGVAYGYSVAVTLGLDGEPFYWELATLLDVMLLGHWMEMRSVVAASRALDHLASMVPSVAHRLEPDGSARDVSVADLVAGDRILVRPGEQVPIDGTIAAGASALNEAFLTGESRPVDKVAGDEAIAGSVNGEGALTVVVARVGAGTTLRQIMRLVEDAQASRSRFQVLADRAALWLTIIAVIVAVPTLVIWLIVGSEGSSYAVARAVTVLVIACPHALGLAIPLVTTNATTIAARNGILVRNREAFERGQALRFVAFDKTGTLTEGTFVMRGIATDGTEESEALALAAALERASEHPLAAAVVNAAEDRGVPIPEASEVTAVPGKGVAGTVRGRSLRIGKPEWAEETGIQPAPGHRDELRRASERGESAIVLFDDSSMLGVFSLADRVRPGARAAVDRLRTMGIEPVMITGDAEAVAATVAGELGIGRFHARVLPADKARIVTELRQEGPTAFVGDGINDAPALLAADLGIAIGAGTNVAIESADLVLIDDDPVDVARAVELSRATARKMRQNLAWATGYNVIAMPLAAGVAASAGIVLEPAVGALFMSSSTVIVALNAMLLRRFEFSKEGGR